MNGGDGSRTSSLTATDCQGWWYLIMLSWAGVPTCLRDPQESVWSAWVG